MGAAGAGRLWATVPGVPQALDGCGLGHDAHLHVLRHVLAEPAVKVGGHCHQVCLCGGVVERQRLVHGHHATAVAAVANESPCADHKAQAAALRGAKRRQERAEDLLRPVQGGGQLAVGAAPAASAVASVLSVDAMRSL